MTANRYVLAVTVIAMVMAGVVVLFNRVVDPFWYYRDVSVSGFNAVKTEFWPYERLIKPSIVIREQPASLIFGSSYSEIGFDPMHPALRAVGRSYNFAFAGAEWDMVFCDVQFAISHDAGLRQIVLGIHPDAMPQKDCKAEFAKMEHPEEREFLFSRDALEASINTVLHQRTEKPSHTAEGLFYYARGKAGTENRFREVFAQHTPCEITSVSPVGMSPPATSHKQSDIDLSGLREIVRSAKSKNITLKLVVYPRHALLLEQDYQCGLRQARWDALAQIVSMVQKQSGGQAEVWDFEGYHMIGTDPISDAAGIYWQDPGHFNYEFGNVMLDEMFAIKPPVFGARLTMSDLPVRAARERKARAAYLHAHPEFMKQLASLLPHHAH